MAVGIIAEYNPFHNGHMYHLEKVKEMFPDEEIVLVMSSSFTERGIPSIIDKWKKTEIALKVGIDLIIELPYVFSTESADYFSYGALTILENLKVEKIVFGSETNDINIFETIVDTELNNEDFNLLTKFYLKTGCNYPTALSKSLLDITGKNLNLPNDLLGISYVKVIRENNYKIKPICIKRNNNYHDLDIDNEITSATAIRKALKEGKDISKNIPSFAKEYLKDLHFEDDYFKFLKYKIITEKDLSIYQTVDEGIENKLKKEIYNSTSYEDLIERVKSKRYTHAKINRMLCHILCNFTKEDARSCKELEYIRVLGFNDKGRNYLNKIKKDIEIPIISNFTKYKSLEIELLVTSVYASTLSEEKKNELIKMEYTHHPFYEEKISKKKKSVD